MKTLIRLGAISAVITAAISAQAVTFAFQTEGRYGESSNTLVSNEAGATYRTGHDSLLTVTSVDYTLTEVAAGVTGFPGSEVLSGTGHIAGKYNGQDYTLTFTIGGGAIFRANNATLKRSFAGDIVNFSIAGSALNGYSGTGTFGGTFLGDQGILSGISKTSFDLDAEAVPEPASMAALGLGLAGIAARRKRK